MLSNAQNRKLVLIFTWGAIAFFTVRTVLVVVYPDLPIYPTHVCPATGDCYEVFP